MFHQAKNGRYAAVLSLYHDQGHIATKTLDFERTISLTLGLPFLRTSVDHGTAFDIAWQGKASAVSMVESLLVAARSAPPAGGCQPHLVPITTQRRDTQYDTAISGTQMLLGFGIGIFLVFLESENQGSRGFWRCIISAALHRHHRRHADARRRQIHYHRFWHAAGQNGHRDRLPA